MADDNKLTLLTTEELYEIMIKDHKLLTEMAKRDERGFDIGRSYIKKSEALDYFPIFTPGEGIAIDIDEDDVLNRTIRIDPLTTATRQWCIDYVENRIKIDKIKRNGVELAITNKTVDITVADKTSDLTNDGDGSSPFATQEYVGEHGGKIDKIYKNDVLQEITPDKSVYLDDIASKAELDRFEAETTQKFETQKQVYAGATEPTSENVLIWIQYDN